MKKLILGVVILLAAWQLAQHGGTNTPTGGADSRGDSVSRSAVDAESDVIAEAFRQQRSNVQVHATGVVARILADDRDGSPHQRFILRLDSGNSVLIAHNIALAPRVDALREGDSIEFSGEYEWNNKGGVVHWTHRDPSGRHRAGWLRHAGRTYQ